MGKEVKGDAKKESTTKKVNNKTKKTSKNKVVLEELKDTAKNVKKEFVKAKDILIKGIKDNTDSIPKEINNIKDKIVDEFNNSVKAKNKKSNSKKKTPHSSENDNKFEKYKDKLENFLNLIKKKMSLFVGYIKKIPGKKVIVILLSLFVIFLMSLNIFDGDIKYDYDYVEEIVLKYRVKVNIDFEENLLFSKYDVKLSSSDKTEILKHGVDKTVEFFLEEGEHTLTFISADDNNISNQVTINVTSNMEVGFDISCHYNKISVTKKYTDKDEELVDDEIKINFDNSLYIYKNYKIVINDLEKLGFINIKENPMYDIELGWTDEGEVDSVKIDGKDNYKRGDIFKKNVEVIVSYHMNANDDPSKIMPPYDGSTANGKKYEDVVNAFKEAGFTNVTAVESSNYFDKPAHTVSGIDADGSAVSKSKAYKPETKIEIKYYGKSEDYDSKSSNTLSLYYAKKAFEQYGKKQYRYGFKCHWILDFIAKEQSADGTLWYFKVGVTIENAYGNKYDAIAEGRVSGNDYSQKVTDFYVS